MVTALEDLLVYLTGEGYILFISGVVLSYILLEAALPLLPSKGSLIKRWYVNLSLHLINSITVYVVIFHLFGVNLEEQITLSGIGLFPLLGEVPLWIQFLVFALVADLGSYGIHRLYHNWRPLWRIHLVHHTDTDIDITDSFRFHPLQILLEVAMRLLITLLLGVPLLILVLFDVLYTLFVFYPHANVKVPRPLERLLRTVIVTSDMHRIHHSSRPQETNSNYGDIFSLWERIFRSYRFLEWDSQRKMELGLEYFRKPEDQSPWRVLMQPFNYRPRERRRLTAAEEG